MRAGDNIGAMSGRRRLILFGAALAVVIVAAFALDWSNRRWHFGQDAALYAVMGERIAGGDADAFRNGGAAPGVPTLLAAAIAAGLDVAAAHRGVALAGYLALAAGAALFFRRIALLGGASRASAEAAGVGVAALWCTTTYVIACSSGPLTDPWSVGAFLAGSSLLPVGAGRTGRVAMIGVLAAAGYCARYVTIFPAAVLVGWAALWVPAHAAPAPGPWSERLRRLAAGTLPVAVAVAVCAALLHRAGYGWTIGTDLQTNSQVALATGLTDGTYRSTPEVMSCLNADGTVSAWHIPPESPHAWNWFHWQAVAPLDPGFDRGARLAERLRDLPGLAREFRDCLLGGSNGWMLALGAAGWLWLAAARRLRGPLLCAVPVIVAAGLAVVGGLLFCYLEPRYLWVLSLLLTSGAAAAAALAWDLVRERRSAVRVVVALVVAIAVGAGALRSARDVAGAGFGPSRRAHAEVDRWIDEQWTRILPVGRTERGAPTVVARYPGNLLRPGLRWLPLPAVWMADSGDPAAAARAFDAYADRGGAEFVLILGGDSGRSNPAAGLLAAKLPDERQNAWQVVAELPPEGGGPGRPRARILRRRR